MCPFFDDYPSSGVRKKLHYPSVQITENTAQALADIVPGSEEPAAPHAAPLTPGAARAQLQQDLALILPVWQEYFARGYNRGAATVETILPDIPPQPVPATLPEAVRTRLHEQVQPATEHYRAIRRLLMQPENGTAELVKQATRLGQALQALPGALQQLEAEALMTPEEEVQANRYGLLTALTDRLLAAAQTQVPESVPERADIFTALQKDVLYADLLAALVRVQGREAVSGQLEQLDAALSQVRMALHAAQKVRAGLAAQLIATVPASVLGRSSGRALAAAALRDPGRAGDPRVVMTGHTDALTARLKETARFLSRARRWRERAAGEMDDTVKTLNSLHAEAPAAWQRGRETLGKIKDRARLVTQTWVNRAAKAAPAQTYDLRAASALAGSPRTGDVLPAFSPDALPVAARVQLRVAALLLLEENARLRTLARQIPRLMQSLENAQAQAQALSLAVEYAAAHQPAPGEASRQVVALLQTPQGRAAFTGGPAQARTGLEAVLAGLRELADRTTQQTLTARMQDEMAQAQQGVTQAAQRSAVNRAIRTLEQALHSGQRSLSAEAEKLAAALARALDETAADKKAARAQAVQQAALTGEEATSVRQYLKSRVQLLTGRSLHSYSRGGMLARGIAEWGQAEQAALIKAGLAAAEAERLVRETVAQMTESHFGRETDPAGRLLLKRTETALAQAAAGTLHWPSRPEERLAQAGGVEDYLLRWAGRQLSGGVVRSLLFGAPQLAINTLFLVPRQAIALMTSLVQWRLGVHQLYRGVRPGEDVPGWLRAEQHSLRVWRAMFRQGMAALPRPVKLVVALALAGYGVVKGRGATVGEGARGGLPVETGLSGNWYLVRQGVQAGVRARDREMAARAAEEAESYLHSLLSASPQEAGQAERAGLLRGELETLLAVSDAEQLGKTLEAVREELYAGSADGAETARLTGAEPEAGSATGESRGRRRKRAISESGNDNHFFSVDERIASLKAQLASVEAALAQHEQEVETYVKDAGKGYNISGGFIIAAFPKTLDKQGTNLNRQRAGLLAKKNQLEKQIEVAEKERDQPLSASEREEIKHTGVEKNDELSDLDIKINQLEKDIKSAEAVQKEHLEKMRGYARNKGKAYRVVGKVIRADFGVKLDAESITLNRESRTLDEKLKNLKNDKKLAEEKREQLLKSTRVNENEQVKELEKDQVLKVNMEKTNDEMLNKEDVPVLQPWINPDETASSTTSGIDAGRESKVIMEKIEKFSNFSTQELTEIATNLLEKKGSNKQENDSDLLQKSRAIWKRNQKNYLDIIYENVNHDYRYGVSPKKYLSGSKIAIKKLFKDRMEVVKLLAVDTLDTKEEAMLVALYRLLTQQINQVSAYQEELYKIEMASSGIENWGYFTPVLMKMRNPDYHLAALDDFRIEAVRRFYPLETGELSDKECIDKYKEIVNDLTGAYGAGSDDMERFVKIREYLLYQYLQNIEYFSGRRAIDIAMGNIDVAEFMQFSRKILEGEAISYIEGVQGEGQFIPLEQVQSEAEEAFTTDKQFYSLYRDFINDDSVTAGKIYAEKFFIANEEVLSDYNAIFKTPKKIETYTLRYNFKEPYIPRISGIVTGADEVVFEKQAEGFIKIITIENNEKYLFSTLGSMPVIVKYNDELKTLFEKSNEGEKYSSLKYLLSEISEIESAEEAMLEVSNSAEYRNIIEENDDKFDVEYFIKKEKDDDNRTLNKMASEFYRGELVKQAEELMKEGNESLLGHLMGFIPFYTVFKRWHNDPEYTPTASDMAWDIADVAISFGVVGAGAAFKKIGELKKILNAVIKEVKETEKGLSGIAFYSKTLQKLSRKVMVNADLKMLHSAIETLAITTADAFNPMSVFQSAYTVAESAYRRGRNWVGLRRGWGKKTSKLTDGIDISPDPANKSVKGIESSTSYHNFPASYKEPGIAESGLKNYDELEDRYVLKSGNQAIEEKELEEAIGMLPSNFTKEAKFTDLAKMPEGQCDRAAALVVAMLNEKKQFETSIIGCVIYNNINDTAPMNHYAVLVKNKINKQEVVIDITFEQFISKYDRENKPLITSLENWQRKLAYSDRLQNEFVIIKEYKKLADAKKEIAYTDGRTFLESDYMKDENFVPLNMPVNFLKNMSKQLKRDLEVISNPQSLAKLSKADEEYVKAELQRKELNRLKFGDITKSNNKRLLTIESEIKKVTMRMSELDALKKTPVRINRSLEFFNKVNDMRPERLNLTTSVSPRLNDFLEESASGVAYTDFDLRAVTANGIATFSDGKYLILEDKRYHVLLLGGNPNKALVKVSDKIGLNIEFNGHEWRIMNEENKTVSDVMFDAINKLPAAANSGYSVVRPAVRTRLLAEKTIQKDIPHTGVKNILNLTVNPVSEDIIALYNEKVKYTPSYYITDTTDDPAIFIDKNNQFLMRIANSNYLPFSFTQGKDAGYLRIEDSVVFVNKRNGQWVLSGISFTLNKSPFKAAVSPVESVLINTLEKNLASNLPLADETFIKPTEDPALFMHENELYIKAGDDYYNFRYANVNQKNSGYISDGNKTITVVKDNEQWTTAGIIPPVEYVEENLKNFIRFKQKESSYQPYAPVKGDFRGDAGIGIYIDQYGHRMMWIEGNYFPFRYADIINKENEKEGLLEVNGKRFRLERKRSKDGKWYKWDIHPFYIQNLHFNPLKSEPKIASPKKVPPLRFIPSLYHKKFKV